MVVEELGGRAVVEVRVLLFPRVDDGWREVNVAAVEVDEVVVGRRWEDGVDCAVVSVVLVVRWEC